MNKIKLFLFAVAIIVIASTSFMGIAMAAQVAGINKSKGRVHINGGVNDGFIPGATVCFFVSSESYGDEFVCGSVVSAEASIATVKVSKSRAKKMKMGTEAMLHVEKEAKERKWKTLIGSKKRLRKKRKKKKIRFDNRKLTHLSRLCYLLILKISRPKYFLIYVIKINCLLVGVLARYLKFEDITFYNPSVYHYNLHDK